MNWQLAKEFGNWAREKPAAATVFVMIVLAGWAVYAHFDHAKADEVTAVKQEVAELKGDVKAVKDDVKEGRIEALEAQLFDAKVQQCAANGELKPLYAERVAKLLSDFRSLTTKAVDLPDCSEL